MNLLQKTSTIKLKIDEKANARMFCQLRLMKIWLNSGSALSILLWAHDVLILLKNKLHSEPLRIKFFKYSQHASFLSEEVETLQQ